MKMNTQRGFLFFLYPLSSSFHVKLSLICYSAAFVTVPGDQQLMRQAAMSYRSDRTHGCYYKLQPQEAILHKTKGKTLQASGIA